jgi:hypothetical protein
MQYLVEIKQNGKVIFSLLVPYVCSLIEQRETAMQALNEMNNDKIGKSLIRKALDQMSVVIGVYIVIEDKKLPIAGYFGNEVSPGELLDNKAIEYEYYQKNGLASGLDTQEVYSIKQKQQVLIINS